MRKILLDTNAYTAFKRNDPDIVEILRQADFIGIDVTVIAELLAGFRFGRKSGENRRDLKAFINTPRVEVLDHTLETSEFYAGIYLDLRKKGKPVPANDIWIAAVTMQHGLALLTRDRHFKHIDGLILI